jgi:hypothetical protein
MNLRGNFFVLCEWNLYVVNCVGYRVADPAQGIL